MNSSVWNCGRCCGSQSRAPDRASARRSGFASQRRFVFDESPYVFYPAEMRKEDDEHEQPNSSTKHIMWADFLATVPPGQARTVNFLAKEPGSGSWRLATPAIKLFCDDPECDDETFFDAEHSGGSPNYDHFQEYFLSYRCRHCQRSSKLFAVLVKLEFENAKTLRGEAEKIGEYPIFAPHVPSRVNKLIGPDREFFFKGRRAESQGMGIGAFGYYRRAVENQKNRIIDEILRVCQRIGASPQVIKELERAKAETQFHKAVQIIKKGIPDVLKIDGHNPLLLLHSALSEGLHSQDDEQCLELATSIRIVLTELAERLDQALKEQAELKTAVSRLLTQQTGKASKATTEAPKSEQQS